MEPTRRSVSSQLAAAAAGGGLSERRISDNYSDSLVDGRTDAAARLELSDIDEHRLLRALQISLMAPSADSAISFKQTNCPIQMSSRSVPSHPLLTAVGYRYKLQ